MKILTRWFALIALVLFANGVAQASLILHIERVSDTLGIVTGSGTLQNPAAGGNRHFLAVAKPFAAAIPPFSNTPILDPGTTMKFGTETVQFAHTVGSGQKSTSDGHCIFFGAPPTCDDGFYFGLHDGCTGSLFLLCDPISGAMQLILPAGISFAAIGTSGDVYWGIPGVPGAATGTWEIVEATSTWRVVPAVPIPIPSTAVLLALGLAGLGFSRRNQQN